MSNLKNKKSSGWLLFFYSVPSKPAGNRVRIWRKLAGAGAVQLKGSVYVLPDSEEHYELFQWLTGEVAYMNGGAAFVKVGSVETMSDTQLIDVFNRHAEEQYAAVAKEVEEVEAGLDSIRKDAGAQAGGGGRSPRQLARRQAKCAREFDRIRGVDFFKSEAGEALKGRLESIKTTIDEAGGAIARQQPPRISLKRKEDYRGRKWATRRRPYVDRMASAWLIRRFIDNGAEFVFINEKEFKGLGGNAVTFDIRGGEFTHVGDMCTFEVLLKAFGFRARTLKAIAELVHELDLKDGKFKRDEASGVEKILKGIKKTAKNDAEALGEGMNVFEALCSSIT